MSMLVSRPRLWQVAVPSLVRSRSFALVIALLAATWTAACGDDATAPAPQQAATARIASVEYAGTRAVLYLDATGTRNRIAFTGAIDPIAGNSPQVPPLADANLLALGPLAWSPDGERLAMVATLANDQSELVVLKKDGSEPRVASVNTQIILGGLDWSPDGTRLAYGMSTLPQARGVDLFVTNLVTNQVQRITQGGSYRPIGGTVRFSTDGASLFYAKKRREGDAPLFETYSEIRRIDLATGTDVAVSGELVGEVQAIARSGAWAIVIRRVGQLAGGDFDRALVRVGATGGTDQVLVASGKLNVARLTPDDSRVLLVRSEGTAASPQLVHLMYPLTGGAMVTLRGTGAQTVTADAWYSR